MPTTRILRQPTTMTPGRIASLRSKLAENTATFGRRFARSGRAVEDWEQGRRTPDRLVCDLLARLARRHGV